jgi:hypothetical protein
MKELAGIHLQPVQLDTKRFVCEVFKHGRKVMTTREAKSATRAKKLAVLSMVKAGQVILRNQAVVKGKKTGRDIVIGWLRRASGGCSIAVSNEEIRVSNRISKTDMAKKYTTMVRMVQEGLIDRPVRGWWCLTWKGLGA